VIRPVGRDAGVPTTARHPPTAARAPAPEMSAGLHAALVEPSWELPHDSRAQPIGHGENMQVHRLKVGDACREVATKFIARLHESLIEMFPQGRPHCLAGRVLHGQ
jgi:hypothetical protein